MMDDEREDDWVKLTPEWAAMKAEEAKQDRERAIYERTWAETAKANHEAEIVNRIKGHNTTSAIMLALIFWLAYSQRHHLIFALILIGVAICIAIRDHQRLMRNIAIERAEL